MRRDFSQPIPPIPAEYARLPNYGPRSKTDDIAGDRGGKSKKSGKKSGLKAKLKSLIPSFGKISIDDSAMYNIFLQHMLLYFLDLLSYLP